MRWFDYIMNAFNWLLVIAVCALGILAILMDLSEPATLLVTHWKPRTILALASAAVVVLEILWLWSHLTRRLVTFTNPRGRIMVSTTSLEKSLARAIRAMKEVVSASVRVSSLTGQKMGIDITAFVTLKEGPDLLGVQENIQSVMEARFAEMLETSRQKKFNVVITRLKGVSKRESPIPPDFTGPQFPVRDEDAPHE